MPDSHIPFTRSIAGKLAFSTMLIVALAIMLLYVATRAHMSNTTRAALESRVDTDLAGLVDIHASGGETELVKRLQDRLAFNDPETGALYLLIRADGKVLAGNLQKWPPLDSARSQIGEITRSDGQKFIARSTQLDPSLRLLVGRSTREQEDMLAALTGSFLWTGIGVVLLALLAGHLLSRNLSRRLAAIDQMHDNAMRGEAIESAKAPVVPGDELQTLAERTRKMLARQAELVRLYRESSEHAAHEIRTPLMHLDQRLHRLIGQSADPRVEDAVARGRQDIRSVVRLLESLLDISATRTQQGDRSDFTNISVTAMIEDLVDIYRDSAEEKGYVLHAELEPLVSMEGNEMQMQRLVTNLLDNAFKYCPAGSRIDVQLSAGPVLRISDNGPGISPEVRARIFERFVRGSNSASGHGLGLALAHAIAERHGLVLSIEDAPRGACFRLAPAVEVRQ